MNRRLAIDIAERATWTFLQTAAGVIIASAGLGADVWKAAAVAGLLAVVKGIAAGRIGDDHTAAALPASLDETAPAARKPRRR